MKNPSLYFFLHLLVGFVLIGCAAKHDHLPPEPSGYEGGSPRIVVEGQVSNAEGQPLSGIYVAIYGVRAPQEQDILTYNYARTDSIGHYSIIRYRGKECPVEITVVATDSTDFYQEQTRIVSLTYDSVRAGAWAEKRVQYNGFAYADFLLEPKYP